MKRFVLLAAAGVLCVSPALAGPQPNPWRKAVASRVTVQKPDARKAPSLNLPAVSGGQSTRCNGPVPPSWCWKTTNK